MKTDQGLVAWLEINLNAAQSASQQRFSELRSTQDQIMSLVHSLVIEQVAMHTKNMP